MTLKKVLLTKMIKNVQTKYFLAVLHKIIVDKKIVNFVGQKRKNLVYQFQN